MNNANEQKDDGYRTCPVCRCRYHVIDDALARAYTVYLVGTAGETAVSQTKVSNSSVCNFT